MIILILGYRWQKQKADNRHNHYADEDEYAIVAGPARHHLTTIAGVTVKVRALHQSTNDRVKLGEHAERSAPVSRQ
jgi:hypothetical protein